MTKSPVIGPGVAKRRMAVPPMNAAASAGPSYLSLLLRSKVRKTISGVKATTIASTTTGHSETGRCMAAMPPITAIAVSIATTKVMLKPEGSICSLRRTQSCRRRFNASGMGPA